MVKSNNQSNSSHSNVAPIPLLRKKRAYLFILLSLVILVVYLRLPSSSSPSNGPFSTNSQRQTKNLIHAKGPLKKPTPALEAMALQQGLLRPQDANGNDLPADKHVDDKQISNSENLFFLFQALGKQGWNLNQNDDYKLMQPKSIKEMVRSLGRLGLDNKKLVSEAKAKV